MSNDSFLRPVQDFNPASASYSSGQVLTHTQLNTDNDYETTALGIISEIIGDIEGSNTTYRSPAFINALGRAIGSMGLLNPVFSEDWTEVQTLCTTGVVYGPFAISDNVTKIVLDFIPTAAPTIAGYSAVTARESLATAMFYWSASNRTLEFYDALTSAITVQYDPGATAPAYPSSYFEGDGFNVIPSLPDIADSGVGATVTGVSPNYEIDFSSITTGEPTNIADLTNVNSYSTRLAFTAFTSNPKYYVPKFIRDAANLKTGGGLNLTGITFNLPTNAVSLFEINGTVVGNKINANFTFTYNIADDDKIYVGGDAVALAVLEELKTSQQKLAVVFTQGESLAQIASYTKSMLLQHNHGADGGQPISALDLIDVKPGGMGSSSMSDGTIPMNWAPQYLHRGGFTTTAPYISGNAFTGDLRLSDVGGVNSTLLNDPVTFLAGFTNPTVPASLTSNLVSGATSGKLTVLDGADLKLVIFGNTGDIYQTSNTNIFGNGGINFTGGQTDTDSLTSFRISNVSKTIPSYSASVANFTQIAGNINISPNNSRGLGIRTRVNATTFASNNWANNIFLGLNDITLATPVVADYAAFGIAKDAQVNSSALFGYFGVSSSGMLAATDIWENAQLKIFNTRTSITPSYGVKTGFDFEVSSSNTIITPIDSAGARKTSNQLYWDNANLRWNFSGVMTVNNSTLFTNNRLFLGTWSLPSNSVNAQIFLKGTTTGIKITDNYVVVAAWGSNRYCTAFVNANNNFWYISASNPTSSVTTGEALIIDLTGILDT